MEYKYEIIKFSDKYPAKIYLQNKPGRRCNTRYHWHRAMELLYIVDGEINVKDEGEVTSLKNGDIYFVGHDRFHKTFTLTPDKNIKYLVVQMSYDKLLKYYPNLKNPEFCISESSKDKITALLEQIAFYFETAPLGYVMKINSLLHDIYFVLMSECGCENISKTNSVSDKELEYVKAAIEYMGYNYLEDLTLNDIANEIGLSSSYFSRCFKSITRTSVMHYLAKIRLESALRDVVEENKTVTDAAFDNGFTSVKSFIELCKKVYNCTPGQYKFQNQ
ncbi:MAG: helix-turn-helix domain-containing protein [Ruminococcus sp.]|nr:helix-turn-helix domain-containing protein [Ruminococcus sp.]